jgi:hypothetical protein
MAVIVEKMHRRLPYELVINIESCRLTTKYRTCLIQRQYSSINFKFSTLFVFIGNEYLMVSTVPDNLFRES